MIKSNFLFIIINLYPIILNIIIIIILSSPSKNNKFNPINLILILILLTILISLKINYYTNSWRSFTLFLIIIGGLIIIFIYITRIANNELFKFNYKVLLINSIKILPLIFIIFILNLNLYDWNRSNTWYNFNINNISLNFSEIYIKPYNNNTYFIINYLFYSIICIINICYKFKLPLRQLII